MRSILSSAKRMLLAPVFAVVVLSAAPAPAQHATAPPTHSRPSPALSNNQRKFASPVSFVDVTRAAGIDFHLFCGGPQKRYIMESMCGGVAVFDYDNDGWMDIFLVNGSTLEDLRANCHARRKISSIRCCWATRGLSRR